MISVVLGYFALEIPQVQKLWEHMCQQHVKLTAVTLGCVVEVDPLGKVKVWSELVLMMLQELN